MVFSLYLCAVVMILQYFNTYIINLNFKIMKQTTTTTAGKTAAKKNTTTAAKVAKTAAAAAPTMDAAAVLDAAKVAAKGCTSCKQIAAKFDALVAKYGKINAAAIQAAAKQIVKDANNATKDAAAAGVAYLSNGAKVAGAAWSALLKEDTAGAKFAGIVFDACKHNLNTVITRYASILVEKDGAKVPGVRKTTKDAITGKTIEYFVPRNMDTVAGYLAALKLAVRNAKRAALGVPASKWQKVYTY